MRHHVVLGVVLFCGLGCGTGVDSSSGGNAPDFAGGDAGSGSSGTSGSGASSGTSGGGVSSGSTGGTSSGSSGSTSGGTDGGVRVDAGGDFNGPPVCTSGTNYTTGNNADMEPGKSCLTCHKVGGAATATSTSAAPCTRRGTSPTVATASPASS